MADQTFLLTPAEAARAAGYEAQEPEQPGDARCQYWLDRIKQFPPFTDDVGRNLLAWTTATAHECNARAVAPAATAQADQPGQPSPDLQSAGSTAPADDPGAYASIAHTYAQCFQVKERTQSGLQWKFDWEDCVKFRDAAFVNILRSRAHPETCKAATLENVDSACADLIAFIDAMTLGYASCGNPGWRPSPPPRTARC